MSSQAEREVLTAQVERQTLPPAFSFAPSISTCEQALCGPGVAIMFLTRTAELNLRRSTNNFPSRTSASTAAASSSHCFAICRSPPEAYKSNAHGAVLI